MPEADPSLKLPLQLPEPKQSDCEFSSSATFKRSVLHFPFASIAKGTSVGWHACTDASEKPDEASNQRRGSSTDDDSLLATFLALAGILTIVAGGAAGFATGAAMSPFGFIKAAINSKTRKMAFNPEESLEILSQLRQALITAYAAAAAESTSSTRSLDVLKLLHYEQIRHNQYCCSFMLGSIREQMEIERYTPSWLMSSRASFALYEHIDNRSNGYGLFLGGLYKKLPNLPASYDRNSEFGQMLAVYSYLLTASNVGKKFHNVILKGLSTFFKSPDYQDISNDQLSLQDVVERKKTRHNPNAMH